MSTTRPFEIGLFTFADTARSIEILATEVLPVVRRKTTGTAKDAA